MTIQIKRLSLLWVFFPSICIAYQKCVLLSSWLLNSFIDTSRITVSCTVRWFLKRRLEKISRTLCFSTNRLPKKCNIVMTTILWNDRKLYVCCGFCSFNFTFSIFHIDYKTGAHRSVLIRWFVIVDDWWFVCSIGFYFMFRKSKAMRKYLRNQMKFFANVFPENVSKFSFKFSWKFFF